MFQFIQKSDFDPNTCTLNWAPITGTVDVHWVNCPIWGWNNSPVVRKRILDIMLPVRRTKQLSYIYFLNEVKYLLDDTCFWNVTGGIIRNSWIITNQIIFHLESNGFPFQIKKISFWIKNRFKLCFESKMYHIFGFMYFILINLFFLWKGWVSEFDVSKSYVLLQHSWIK